MRVLLLFAGVVCAAPIVAGAADQTTARNLAATCANCHGTDGRSVTEAVAPLAGKPKDEIVKLMQAFKTGKKPATVMHQISKGYTDQQIELVAGYLAGQTR